MSSEFKVPLHLGMPTVDLPVLPKPGVLYRAAIEGRVVRVEEGNILVLDDVIVTTSEEP